MSSVNKLVCIICLKKFTLNETDNGNSNDNVPLLDKLTYGNLEAETLNCPNSNGTTTAQCNDPYTRFLLFVKGYFKLTTFANRLLTCANEAKNEKGEHAKLQTFCDSCGQLVSEICKLYKELQTAQLFLLWKLSLMGELMKKSSEHATDDQTYKSCGARTSIAKQMNVIAVKPVDMFRKALQLKCVNAAKKVKSKPIVSLYKGLVPDQWKFTYSDTKEALIKLIVLFTLASDQLSIKLPKHNPGIKAKYVKNVDKRRSGRPKKKPKPFQENTGQMPVVVAVSNLDKMVKIEDITTTRTDPSVHEDDDGSAQDNFENDSDWSRDATTPMSISWWKKGRRNVIVIAEEDEGDAAAAKSQECQIGGDGDDPLDIVPSVQCFRYTRVTSNVQVAMHLHSNHLTESEEYPYKCNKCDMRFPKYMDRRAHERKLHGFYAPPIQTKCPNCSKLFPSRLEMWEHRKLTHKNEYKVGHKKKGAQYRPNTDVKPSRKRPLSNVVVKQEIDKASTQQSEIEEADQLTMGNFNQSSESGTNAKLKCPHCPTKFEDGRGLIRHLKSFHHTSIEYPCKTCGMRFKWQRHLRNHHCKMHEPGLGSNAISSSCPKCSEIFPTRTELGRHIKKTHQLLRGAKPVQSTCSKCSEVFPSKQKLFLHMKISHRPKSHMRGRPGANEVELRGVNEKFICEVGKCEEGFELASLLLNHLETVHEEETGKVKKISCGYCKYNHLHLHKKFAYRQTYEMHVRTRHKILIFGMYKCNVETCKVPSFPSVDKLNEHLKSHLEDPDSGISEISFCEKCNWGFTKPELRDLHQLCHIAPGEDGKLECPQCPERHGPNVKLLQNHFNEKHGVNMKPFQCDLCQATFLFERLLVQHKYNYHTKRRECVCELCGAQFSEKRCLDQHMNIHEEPKFPCDVCGVLFKFKHKVNEHKKQMHDPNRSKSFICSDCGKSFYSNAGLQFHFDSAHKPESEWALKCSKCPRRFYRKLYLGIHLKTCDGNEEDEKKRLANEMIDTAATNQSDPIQFDQQTTNVSPELPEKVSSTLPDNSSLENRVQVLPEDSVTIESVNDQTTDNFGHEDDSDWSQGRTSPMSDGGTDGDDCEETIATPRSTRWNLRGHRNVAVKAEEDDKDEESSDEMDDSEKTPVLRKTFKKVKSSCSICSKVLSSKFKLANHMDAVHEKEKPELEKNIQCCYCSARYAYQQSHDMHLRTKHTHKRFQGFKCDLERCEEPPFVSIKELNEHLKSHLLPSEKISFCDKCNWGFLRQGLRDLHQLIHITTNKNDGKLACPHHPQCPKTFTLLRNLQNHFNKVHGLNLKPFECDKCDKSFFAKHSLGQHKRNHQSKFLLKKWSNLKCDQCGVSFLDEDSFEKHINSGHLFNCQEAGCDQKFDTKRKLMIHRTMKHLDSTEREWICEICAGKFGTKRSLQCHMSCLHAERKYTCEVCGASFKRNDKLSLHMNSMHNPERVKSWICSLCGKSYHSVMGLQYHTDSEHKKESEYHLKCPHCPRRFYRNMYLYRHLKTCKKDKMDDQSAEPVQSTSSSTSATSSRKRRLLKGHESSNKEIDGCNEEKSLLSSVHANHEEKMEHSTIPEESQPQHQVLQHGIELLGGAANALTSTSATSSIASVPNFPQGHVPQPLNLNPLFQELQTPGEYNSPETLHQSWTSY